MQDISCKSQILCLSLNDHQPNLFLEGSKFLSHLNSSFIVSNFTLWVIGLGHRVVQPQKAISSIIYLIDDSAIRNPTIKFNACVETAFKDTFHLNHKFALDGCDPSSYGGILWCFGQFDGPKGNSKLFGSGFYCLVNLQGPHIICSSYNLEIMEKWRYQTRHEILYVLVTLKQAEKWRCQMRHEIEAISQD